MPEYAAVYLEDASKTFIALPCAHEWQNRPGPFAVIRLSTAEEAHRRRYRLDEGCKEAGGYIDDDRSLSGLMLERLGVLQPLVHWWDRPFRTEHGMVNPHQQVNHGPV